MTDSEKQAIISTILGSLETNSKTIGQLTPVTDLADTDKFEIDGGRYVTFSIIKQLVAEMASSDQSSLITLINDNKIQSVSITATEGTATLTITTNAGTKTCSVPIASTNTAGLMTAVDKVKLDAAHTAIQDLPYIKADVNTLKTDMATAKGNITTLQTDVDNAEAGIDNLETDVSALNSDVATAKSDISGLKLFRAKSQNLVTLRFAGVLNEVPAGLGDSLSEGGAWTAYYCTPLKAFIGKIARNGVSEYYQAWQGAEFDSSWYNKSASGSYTALTDRIYVCGGNAYSCKPDGTLVELATAADFDSINNRLYIPFDGILNTTDTIPIQSTSEMPSGATSIVLYFSGNNGIFLLRNVASGSGNVSYYGTWPGNELYSDEGAPIRGTIYNNNTDGSLWTWNGSKMACIAKHLELGESAGTAFAGNRGKSLETSMKQVQEELPNKAPLVDGKVPSQYLPDKNDVVLQFGGFVSGVEISDSSTDATPSTSSILFDRSLKRFVCLADGDYVASWPGSEQYQSTAYIPLKGKIYICDKVGYIYDGTTLTDIGVDRETIINLIRTYQPAENVLNVNALCGDPISGGNWVLASAIEKIAELSARADSLNYVKRGLIITYQVAEGKWETKQFNGEVTDFADPNLWVDFGNGGSDLQASDTPVSRGTDAFSTGGAYNEIPTSFVVDTETPGVVKLSMVNAADDTVVDEVQFAVGQGDGGGAAAVLVDIKFDKSTLYGGLGQTIETSAYIRSYVSGSDDSNGIAKLELIDRDTNQIVMSKDVVSASSVLGDTSTYFKIDFTPYMTAAGTRRFKLVVTDDATNQGSKNITVTAEDVTLECKQTLNYVADMAIRPTDASARVPMFAIPNNASDQGIRVVAEMYINGEWRSIFEQIVKDQVSHSLTFSPSTLGLTHGAYPVRVRGKSVASGVESNTIYTTIMVVDPNSTEPIVAIRYNDKANGKIKMLDRVSLDVAAYTNGATQTIAKVKANGVQIAEVLAYPGTTYNVDTQVSGYANDTELEYKAVSGASESPAVTLIVEGSLIDAITKEGELYNLDFSARNNAEPDHTIADKGYTLTVNGCNWSSNGFRPYLGKQALRFAENMNGTLNHAPFAAASIESAGMSLMMNIATDNIKDPESHLVDCYDANNGAGFYVCGNKVAIFCKTGNQQEEIRTFPCRQEVNIIITVERGVNTVARGSYSTMRLYVDGDLSAAIGYVPNSGNLINAKSITFDARNGDLYIYKLMAWNSEMTRKEAFDTYLTNVRDTEAMISEYDFENVLDTSLRPSASAMWDKGMPYIVPVMAADKWVEFDKGTSTSDVFECTLFYYHPQMPWRSFKTTARLRRQGTTSALRPRKNYRFDKFGVITPLFSDYDNTDAQLTYSLFAQKKIRVGENSIPVGKITVKIDYSDSTGANDCSICDMVNATYRAMGAEYMTPAQRHYDGTYTSGSVSLSGLELNHSTANHPVAVFRSTSDSLESLTFAEKGNWKEDKGEQTALGFMNIPGYNKGCLNYQDDAFVEYIGTPEESLVDTVARFLADDSKSADKCYLISMYNGLSYRFYRCIDSVWTDTTGSMVQVDGEWQISGDVLNPVDGFELLDYAGMCWWKGVASVDDLMDMQAKKSKWVQSLIDKGKVTGTEFPAWTQYFECMIDSDALAIAYAKGEKVPVNLLDMLMFCSATDTEAAGADETPTRLAQWRDDLYLHANPRSLYSYYIITDYNAMWDQQAKNMQPMWFIEDGASVNHGEYSANAMRMYLNKVYDCDSSGPEDNDGGCHGDPEADPAKPSVDGGYTNPYPGWDSVLWNNARAQQRVHLSSTGTDVIELRNVASAMRSCQLSVDGELLNPFSPKGAKHYYLSKRLSRWQKVVSAVDGEQKYLNYTGYSADYFYALHGLMLTMIPEFIERRWRIRDGYYETGSFTDSEYMLYGRISCGSDPWIRIVAGKTGYYGIGNETPGKVSKGVLLEAGEEYTFTKADIGGVLTDALFFIYQADRIREIEFHDISLGDNFKFNMMALAEKIIIGSSSYVDREFSYGGKLTSIVTTFDYQLPFLKELNIENTPISSLNLEYAPRLETVYAKGSNLSTISFAESAPVSTVELPDTMTELTLIGLPNLNYNGLNSRQGIKVASWHDVRKLRIEGRGALNPMTLIRDTLTTQDEEPYALNMIRVANANASGDGTELMEIKRRSVAGMDENGNRVADPVIIGEYQLTTIYEDWEIEELARGITGITILTGLPAYIGLITSLMQGESYSGEPEVATVTAENIGEHIDYYNGESYDDYLTTISE